MKKGIVIKSTGSWYRVKEEEKGEIIACRIAGKFRIKGIKLTNPVAVGDYVEFTIEGDDTGFIKNILPRRNHVLRQSPRKKHAMHLLAANIDQALLITTIVNPDLKQGFIDRFLLTTEPYNIPAIIVFNKADVYSQNDIETYEYLKEIYEDIGYTVLLTSAESGDGVEEVKALLKDKLTLVSGQSGVGKSSLINMLTDGEIDIKTTELSDYSGKGQHTTTFAEMHDLPFGGEVIDSPGIKTLSFNNLEPMDVAHNFREFFEASQDCKFGGKCLHRNEPSCAVKEGIEEHTISELRYINYLTLLDEIEEQNYWERHK